ncbi:relaxin receptor 2-like [Lytechinus variegatus]|uniref:relaxin receptor 2-like n=1 Tax=Lytechinus variegatus TaxID=7654 RepID=UPI001BB1615D|nr:relaxin receptor 2-like [Lytechinus variegatus]
MLDLWIVVILLTFVVTNVEAQSSGNTFNQTSPRNYTNNDQEGGFACFNSSLTFDLTDVCDGQNRCPYSDDEYICDNLFCDATQFMCNFGDWFRCVPMRYVCDDYPDCEENVDEIFCDPLANCPPTCECSWYSVFCEGPNVVDDTNILKSTRRLSFRGQSTNGTGPVPISMPFNLTAYQLLIELKITETGIEEIIRSDLETLRELIKLDMSNNIIYSLSNDTFTGLNNLLTLDLSDNYIWSLPDGVFRGLTSLTEIDISYNSISSLSNDTFTGLNDLRTLDLSGNYIESLPDGLFRFLTSLTKIDLSRNVIERLSSDSFAGPTGQLDINLEFNRITVIPAHVFRGLYLRTIHLSLTGINELEPGCFQGLEGVENIELFINNITSIRSGVFEGLVDLKYLHLFENQISDIDIGAFEDLHSLEFLDLTHNSIRELKKGTFDSQVNLTWVSFSDNPLEYIEPGTFQHLSRLEYLNVVNVQLKNLQPDTFSGITSLKGLSTDDHRLCCLFDETDLCSIATSNFLDSCTRLMPNTVLRIALWVIGWGALIGNTIVLVLRCRMEKSASAKTQGLFITNLAIADFLMGVYMVMISSADVYYGEYFFLVAEQWRSSIACKIAGFIAVLSSESSVFILAIITIDRVLCVVFPFGKLKFRSTSARVGVALIWASAFVVSVVPLLVSSYVSGFYGLSDVCVGLPLNVESQENGELVFNHTSRVWEFVKSDATERPSWLYSIALFLGVNFLIFILILISYVVIFASVRKSAHSVASKGAGSSADRAREVKLAIRMSVIVLTDFFCWMPVIIMGILSQSGAVTLPVSLYAWSVVFILPINASINPYIYTFIATCGRPQTKSTTKTSTMYRTSLTETPLS